MGFSDARQHMPTKTQKKLVVRNEGHEDPPPSCLHPLILVSRLEAPLPNHPFVSRNSIGRYQDENVGYVAHQRVSQPRIRPSLFVGGQELERRRVLSDA